MPSQMGTGCSSAGKQMIPTTSAPLTSSHLTCLAGMNAHHCCEPPRHEPPTPLVVWRRGHGGEPQADVSHVDALGSDCNKADQPLAKPLSSRSLGLFFNPRGLSELALLCDRSRRNSTLNSSVGPLVGHRFTATGSSSTNHAQGRSCGCYYLAGSCVQIN